MRIGVNLGPLDPTLLTVAAPLAEQLGFDSLWLGEHVVTPEVVRGVRKMFTPATPETIIEKKADKLSA